MKPVLDTGFRPMLLELRAFEQEVQAAPHQEIAISVVRENGYTETRKLTVYQDGVNDARNCFILERYAKTLLWCYGGYLIIVSGSRVIYECLKEAYQPGGARAYDENFMAIHFEQPFQVEYRESVADAPATKRN
ncbi:MAG: hypothetical protein IJ074_03365, partial [Clostridia bacterium]|nr:hypothetical protein [Clostridia bacterium]